MVKKTTSAKKKSVGFAAEIEKIEACIKQDYVQLEKAYPKILATLEKEVARVKKDKSKAKTTAKPAKNGKAGSRAKAGKAADFSVLDKQLDALATELIAVKASQKKFNAKKKLWLKFEKSWAKTLKKSAGTKKNTTRKTRAATVAEDPAQVD